MTAAQRDGPYRLGHRDVETGLRRNKVMTPGRVTAIIGKERVGF